MVSSHLIFPYFITKKAITMLSHGHFLRQALRSS